MLNFETSIIKSRILIHMEIAHQLVREGHSTNRRLVTTLVISAIEAALELRLQIHKRHTLLMASSNFFSHNAIPRVTDSQSLIATKTILNSQGLLSLMVEGEGVN